MKKRLRLSLRVLMFFIVGFAVFLGWQVNVAHKQRDAVEAIKAYGGDVVYEPRFGPLEHVPVWIRRSVGAELFEEVTGVNLSFVPSPTVKLDTPDVVSHLAELPSVKSIVIQGRQANN